MTVTLTVEGDMATVDAIANLTTQGSVTAPSLVLPAGVKRISKIYAAAAADGAAAGSASFLLRLGGNAVQNGEQTITVGAAGIIAVQAGSDAAPEQVNAFVLEDADIEVVADTIRIQAEMDGNDLGTSGMVVTLYLE